MSEVRSGILAGGNWIIDRVKIIDKYPTEESLANILSEQSSNGGSAYNILKDLSRMKAPFSLAAIGLVGEDELGNMILRDCNEHGIDTAFLSQTPLKNTSYTDVMSVQATGKRTFFHNRGANSLLDVQHFNLEHSASRIFHLGYLLLLDKMDAILGNGRTVASVVLQNAVNQGFITTVDLVSEDSDRFKTVVPPSLPYVDYLFINEYEAGMLADLTLLKNGQISAGLCLDAARRILDMGVRRWVILHFPAGVIAVSREGEHLFQPCVDLPADKIAGAVGAGDAFAAGVLLGIHEGWSMQQSLQMGVCAAACSLMAATCSDGVLASAECLALGTKYGYRDNNIRNDINLKNISS